MRGYPKGYKIKPNKFYIVTTDRIKEGNYSLLNKEFNTRAEAQETIDLRIKERKYYNEVVKGKEAIEWGFKFTHTGKNIRRYYKYLVKYTYPDNYDEMTPQDRKSWRTRKRRQWRRSQKRKRRS